MTRTIFYELHSTSAEYWSQWKAAACTLSQKPYPLSGEWLSLAGSTSSFATYTIYKTNRITEQSIPVHSKEIQRTDTNLQRTDLYLFVYDDMTRSFCQMARFGRYNAAGQRSSPKLQPILSWRASYQFANAICRLKNKASIRMYAEISKKRHSLSFCGKLLSVAVYEANISLPQKIHTTRILPTFRFPLSLGFCLYICQTQLPPGIHCCRGKKSMHPLFFLSVYRIRHIFFETLINFSNL